MRETTVGQSGTTAFDRRERLRWYASVACLAPSKHNTQPWRFLVRADAVEVWPEASRRLPVTDPDGRELVLSCGAAVHAARVAARAAGFRLSVTPFPHGPAGPLARLVEDGPHVTTPLDRELLDAVRRRRTDRGPLDGAALGPVAPFSLQDVATRRGCTLRLVTSPGQLGTLARLVEEADLQLVRRPEAAQELQQWLRPDTAGHHDGVPATAARSSRSTRSGPVVQRDFSIPGSRPGHDRPGADAPLVGVLCTDRDEPADRLRAGEGLMALLLVLTAAGGAASFLNQPLELRHTRDLLREQLDLPGVGQVVLRMGVGAPVAATPRRAPDDVVQDVLDDATS